MPGHVDDPTREADRERSAESLIDTDGGAFIRGGVQQGHNSTFVGRDLIKNIYNTYNSLTWGQKILGVLVGSILLMSALVVLAEFASPYFAKMPEPPSFNIAVAGFVTVDSQGRVIKVNDGKEMAQYLTQRLDIELEALGWSEGSYEIWGPSRVRAQIRGADRKEREQQARQVANDLNANILIYGVITYEDGRNGRFEPEFFVDYQGFEEAPEIVGQHQLGSPITVDLPLDMTVEDARNPTLSARARALSHITIGLLYYSSDRYDNATGYFKQAAEDSGWFRFDGKEVVYLLLGNSEVRRASIEKTTEPLTVAQEYYATALEINPNYGRALIGEAGILYLTVIGDPSDPQPCQTNYLEKLDLAVQKLEQARSLRDQPLSAHIDEKVHFELGQNYLARSYCESPGSESTWLEQARVEFREVIASYEGGNTGIVELAGQSYARLALIADVEEDLEEAAELYESAIQLVSPISKGYYYARLGDVYVALERREDARNAYAQAMEHARKQNRESDYLRYRATYQAITPGND